MRGLTDLRVFATQAQGDRPRSTGHWQVAEWGTRLYIAGSESFQSVRLFQVAMNYNLNADEVQREHVGNAARRVYCIHCQSAKRKTSRPTL